MTQYVMYMSVGTAEDPGSLHSETHDSISGNMTTYSCRADIFANIFVV